MNTVKGLIASACFGSILSADALLTQVQAQDKESKPDKASTTSAGSPSETQTPAPSTIRFVTVFFERLEKDSATVNFSKGTAELVPAEQEKLKSLIPNYRNDKEVDKIYVAAWGDRPYPSEKGDKLPDAEEKLAEQRAEKLEEFLEKNGVSDVEKFTMAEKPSWIAKAFHLDSAQVKGAAQNTGTDSLNEDRIEKLLNQKGGPSKAVVIVKHKQEMKNF